MTVVVPPEMPVSTPVVLTMVPTAMLLLLHAPDGVVLVIVIVDPGQTIVGPPMAAGRGFTVIVRVRAQPLVGCV